MRVHDSGDRMIADHMIKQDGLRVSGIILGPDVRRRCSGW